MVAFDVSGLWRVPDNPIPEQNSNQRPRVVPVHGGTDVDRFIRVPWAIYRDDSNWVPPLVIERRRHLDPAHNPYFRHAEAGLWLALRAGRAVGRISAQIDQASLARWRDGTGHFGFLESEDDAATFAALFDTAESWLREKGMRRARGPFSFSINDESGLLVDGFETPPSILMGHARPYYARRITERGYVKAKDLIAYDFRVGTDPLPRSARIMVDRLADESNVRVRKLRKSHYQDDLGTILDIFDDAWSDNWGFVPFDAAKAARVADDLKPLIEEEFVWIAEVDDAAAAFAVSLPNLNEAIADLNGSLFPFGWAKLLYRLKARKLRTSRLPLLGVRKRYQGTPLGAALVFAVIKRIHEALRARGYSHAELSWVLEDNVSMRRVIEAGGAVPYKTYRVFEKALT